MGQPETAGNHAETLSDPMDLVLLSVGRIEGHLSRLEQSMAHMDEQVHSLVRLIDDHRPLLARAAALADPGAKVRAMLHPGRKEGRDRG